jgi:small subunit ribosomal protein S13
MSYILGVNIPEEKHVIIGLRKIFGIGPFRAKLICDTLSINKHFRIKDLTDLKKSRLIKEIQTYTTEGDLKKEIKNNIDKLISIKSYHGLRHNLGLPVRGQRTRSNAKTQRFLSKKNVDKYNLKIKKNLKGLKNIKQKTNKTIKKK